MANRDIKYNSKCKREVAINRVEKLKFIHSIIGVLVCV